MRIELDVSLGRERAFETICEELARALAAAGFRVTLGPDGRVHGPTGEVGRVVAWDPGRLLLAWRPAAWAPDVRSEVDVRVTGDEASSRIRVEHRGLDGLLSGVDAIGWFAATLGAPLLAAASSAALGEWITDRTARRPAGAASRAIYADPLFHYPNFGALLAELRLSPDDYLLDVGCGGGALLHAALATGCRAAGIDHSPDMIRTAAGANAAAIAGGQLTLHEADAQQLPFADGTFSCVSMTGVLGFLRDPVQAFREVRRVLLPGGRFVAFGSDPAWRGTPAAPEPFASHLHFHTDAELAQLAVAAGFDDAQVVRRDLEPHARAAGLPDEVLPMFREEAPFLVARRAAAGGAAGAAGLLSPIPGARR